MIICDLPGVIEGASQGVGLGRSILKHLKNTKVLILVLDPINSDYTIEEQIKLIETEVNKYDDNLKNLPIIKVVNKSDLDKKNDNYLNISALKDEGIDKLIQEINLYDFTNLDSINKSFEKISLHDEQFSVEEENGTWLITGDMVDRISNLNGNDYDVFNEISYRFERSEIPAKLEDLGIEKGDYIKLNNYEFEYEK